MHSLRAFPWRSEFGGLKCLEPTVGWPTEEGPLGHSSALISNFLFRLLQCTPHRTVFKRDTDAAAKCNVQQLD